METPLPPSQKWDGAPKFSVHVYCGQTAEWIKMVLGTEVGLIPGDFVLDGDPPPSPKGGGAPSQIFGPRLLWPGAGWIMMTLGMEMGLGPCRIVLDGDPAPLPMVHSPPQFSTLFYCDQTDGCIKMTISIEVGLIPGNFVLDGDLASAPKRGRAPSFGPRLLWPNGCMDQDATWYGGRPWPTRHCVT